MVSNIRSIVVVAIVALLGCGQTPAPGKASAKQAGKSQEQTKQGVPPQQPPPAPVEPKPPVEPSPPAVEPPIEPAAPTPTEPASPPTPTDLRGDEVIPPGTPEANAKAFEKLALAPGDGAPVGGIGTKDELTIEWIKNGKNTRRSKVAVSDMHAYLTRAYLPISTGYEGEWKAKIQSADGTVLAEPTFTVK